MNKRNITLTWEKIPLGDSDRLDFQIDYTDTNGNDIHIEWDTTNALGYALELLGDFLGSHSECPPVDSHKAIRISINA